MSDIINSERNLRKIRNKVIFYKTYLFKLTVSSISVLAFIFSGMYYANDYMVRKAVKDVTKNVTDSLQWKAIMETRVNNGNVHTRVDYLSSKQNEFKQEQDNTNAKLDNLCTVIIYYFKKMDKSLIPLIEKRVEYIPDSSNACPDMKMRPDTFYKLVGIPTEYESNDSLISNNNNLN